MNKKRIILDTNILISGLILSSSKPQQVFDLVTKKHIVLMSEETLAELFKIFIRPKFEKYISLGQ
ncbi:MAG: putative toxin-antitoxin system toxin component, PIN family [Roseofilum sp. SBFL]|uniref:putative toxin-antitoxin system toxin component, PIN family n=1 Tax=unclassified Roseofilum TaxID=2620099 RepID=UPI001AFDC81D|nr:MULTISPECIES: putative toxin-antitoxin system toxin component, PIN family [unclassified Roseofilum]MBP0012427.1 putative toxin-antitoxin system toxin component, PIN family [Roseofilum sp. SID3]MBP0022628.1 putative toxin-antitoxin system toxin component, PIN family [Roseofilum sp. SID2]MBP0039678.1 putative toxin-antitoxin system toxin component, PIN family [Roseofilum sp. SID1]MBP0042261.1 putative toxin-antitoxin system toxin component, PIN family [Roseofilum sp. SBFL]